MCEQYHLCYFTAVVLWLLWPNPVDVNQLLFLLVFLVVTLTFPQEMSCDPPVAPLQYEGSRHQMTTLWPLMTQLCLDNPDSPSRGRDNVYVTISKGLHIAADYTLQQHNEDIKENVWWFFCSHIRSIQSAMDRSRNNIVYFYCMTNSRQNQIIPFRQSNRVFLHRFSTGDWLA